MICRKCGQEVPEGAYCIRCGAKQDVPDKRKKSRGNGQGTVYQLPNKQYVAVKTLGYYLDENGVKHRKTVSKHFARKKDAVEALARVLLPEIQAFFESEKGQREFADWKAQQQTEQQKQV